MNEREAIHLQQFNVAASQTYPYPADRFGGQGIVICGGGDRYFPCAWVCINRLRHSGCELPIELWHFRNEMSDFQKSLVEPLGVCCVNADEVRKKYPIRILAGWELKSYAIMHSSFQEVLLLDADNVVVRDPSFLFKTEPYQTSGSIFWPDYGRLAVDRSAWKVTGVSYRDEPEFESGQLVIDKSQCWKAINLAMHLNEWSDFFYEHFHGDKETFHLAWRKIEQAYAMPPFPIEDIGGYCMAQHDFEGRRIFQHRNLRKWMLFSNSRDENFEFEGECIAHLDDLAQCLWAQEQIKWSPEERDSYESITLQRHFLYVRRGHDQRILDFLPDGLIGEGAGGMERRWRIATVDNCIVIEIYGEYGKSCALQHAGNNRYIGWWFQKEQMPIYLLPAHNKNEIMTIGIVTIDRGDNYVHTTIADLFANCKEPIRVDLFVGCRNSAYLDQYRYDERITIHELSQADWERIEPWGTHRRCSFNFWRAFRYYSERNTYACLLEDDVIVCNYFCERLREAVSEIETTYPKYILALYSPHDLRFEAEGDCGHYYSSYDTMSFYGIQAMYYPASVLSDLESYFKKFAVENPRDPADLVIASFGGDDNIIYGTRYPIAQHVGYVTTGLGNFHDAPHFDRNYNPSMV